MRNGTRKPHSTTATKRLLNTPIEGITSPLRVVRFRAVLHFPSSAVTLTVAPGSTAPSTTRLKPPSIPSNVSRLLHARINRCDSSFAIKSRYVRISKRRARKSRLVKTLLYVSLLPTLSLLSFSLLSVLLSYACRPSRRSRTTRDPFYRPSQR